MTLHSKLAQIRAQRGLTQVEIVALVQPTFAERGLSVTQGMWSAWERGQRPEDEKIAALEDALDLRPGELFECLRATALAATAHPSARSSWLLHTWSDLPRRIALTVPNARRVSVPTVAA